jgi:hypothetical protein
MLMTEKKPPTRIGTILVWLILIIGMLWLAIPKQASSQTLMEAGHVASHESADPFKLYPNGIEYDVYRKGKKIGQHKVIFKREDGQLIVDTEFKIKVKIFFVTVYRFIFDVAGTWQDGKLVSMTGEVNDNGKKIKIDAYVDYDGKFYTTGKKGAFVADTWVYPTNHWNIGAVDQSVVLNTLTGNLVKVEVVRHGIETVETVTGPVEAEKFEYTGDLRDINVWYDSEGRWVKMVFTTKAGETIELVCRQCGLVNDLEQASASGA